VTTADVCDGVGACLSGGAVGGWLGWLLVLFVWLRGRRQRGGRQRRWQRRLRRCYLGWRAAGAECCTSLVWLPSFFVKWMIHDCLASDGRAGRALADIGKPLDLSLPRGRNPQYAGGTHKDQTTAPTMCTRFWCCAVGKNGDISCGRATHTWLTQPSTWAKTRGRALLFDGCRDLRMEK